MKSSPTHDTEETTLVSMRELGRRLGITHTAVHKLYVDGVIRPEIHEGRLIRFDAIAVRAVLRKRAAKARPVEKLPPGMVPVL